MLLAFFIETIVKMVYKYTIEKEDPDLEEFESLLLWESIIFSFDYVLTFMMILSVVKYFRIPYVNLIMRALVKFLLNTTLTLGLLLLIMTFYCSWFDHVTIGHQIYQFYNFSYSFLNFSAMYITNYEHQHFVEDENYVILRAGMGQLLFTIIFYYFVVRYLIVNLMAASYVDYF